LQFLDIDGKLREISVSSSKIFSSTFEEGFYSDEISNLFLGNEKEDLVLKPIPDSFAVIPWEDSSARLLCKIEKNGKDYSRDSVSMLKKVKNLYSLAGYDEISIQATQEFSMFETVVVDKTSPQRGPSVNLDTREAPWNSNPLAYDNKWQAMTMPQDVYSLIRIQILDSLLSFFRISAQAHIHSKGVAKQGLLLMR
jgi:glutamine synthetase